MRSPWLPEATPRLLLTIHRTELQSFLVLVAKCDAFDLCYWTCSEYITVGFVLSRKGIQE